MPHTFKKTNNSYFIISTMPVYIVEISNLVGVNTIYFRLNSGFGHFKASWLLAH